MTFPRYPNSHPDYVAETLRAYDAVQAVRDRLDAEARRDPGCVQVSGWQPVRVRVIEDVVPGMFRAVVEVWRGLECAWVEPATARFELWEWRQIVYRADALLAAHREASA